MTSTKGTDVLPLTALPTLQVVEARVASTTVPARHMRQTFTLPSHRVTATLLFHCPVWIAITGWSRKREAAKDANHHRKHKHSYKFFGLVLSYTEAMVTYCSGALEMWLASLNADVL
jgi:hypothetical protein